MEDRYYWIGAALVLGLVLVTIAFVVAKIIHDAGK